MKKILILIAICLAWFLSGLFIGFGQYNQLDKVKSSKIEQLTDSLDSLRSQQVIDYAVACNLNDIIRLSINDSLSFESIDSLHRDFINNHGEYNVNFSESLLSDNGKCNEELFNYYYSWWY